MSSGRKGIVGLNSPSLKNMAVDDKSKLLGLLAKYSYRYVPEGLTLSSGTRSNHYVDCKVALSLAEALQPLGRLILGLVAPEAVAVGGLTMGADPIAISTAMASADDRALSWFSVRKEPKKHGLMKLIEGNVTSGDKVVVLDDVVTTGGSTTEAIQKCGEAGLQVVQVIVLVDREEVDQGLKRIQDAAGPNVPVSALFTKQQVRSELFRYR